MSTARSCAPRCCGTTPARPGAAADLITELGDGDDAAGRLAWAEAVGSVPVASFTVTKLRWLADHEPESVERTAAVCLPHDWLTWKLSGATSLGFARHRPQRCQRHRLLVPRGRDVPPRPAHPRPRARRRDATGARTSGPRRPYGLRRAARTGCRRQRGRRPRARCPGRRRRALARHLRGGVRGLRRAVRRPLGDGRGLRRRDRATTCRWWPR